jgi:hypothetical protein
MRRELQVTLIEIRIWGLPIKKPNFIHKSCDQNAPTAQANLCYCEFVLVVRIQSSNLHTLDKHFISGLLMGRSDVVGLYSQTRDNHDVLKFHKNIYLYVCLPCQSQLIM